MLMLTLYVEAVFTVNKTCVFVLELASLVEPRIKLGVSCLGNILMTKFS